MRNLKLTGITETSRIEKRIKASKSTYSKRRQTFVTGDTVMASRRLALKSSYNYRDNSSLKTRCTLSYSSVQ